MTFSLKDKVKFYMLENFKPHVDSTKCLNSTTLAEETIDHLEIPEWNEQFVFDMAVDIIPRLKEAGYINE